MKKRIHTIEGFERDVLPALRKKRYTLEYTLVRMGDAYGEHSNVCLKGAIRVAQGVTFYGVVKGFTNAQLDAMEVGFEGWESDAFTHPSERERRIAAAPEYYKLGKAIYEKYGKEL